METQPYTVLEFKNPPPISESQYYDFKSQISSNPNFEIKLEEKSFFEHFQEDIIKVGIGFIGDVVFFAIAHEFDVNWFWLGLIIFTFLMLVLSVVIRLSSEIPLYKKYKSKSREYFGQMKSAIERSEVYDNFVKLFYTPIN